MIAQEIAYYNQQVIPKEDEIILNIPVSEMEYIVFRQVAEDQGISISQAMIGLVMEYLEDKQDEQVLMRYKETNKPLKSVKLDVVAKEMEV